MAKREDLGFLGIDFQYRLAHHFMDDKKFFRDVSDIIDSNMFTDVNVRRFIGGIKDYFEKYDYVPTYSDLSILLRGSVNSEQEIEFVDGTIDKIKHTSCEGGEFIKDKAHKFFKQQNMVKAINKATEIIASGDIDRYKEIEELLQHAMYNNNRDEIGTRLREGMMEVLSEDYRYVVPTGVKAIDDTLEGGLGKGELALVIGGSGFGKALSINELACTSNGFKKMGELTLDDKVIGRDGKPHNILGIFPQGVRDIYTVKFSDGTQCDCDMEHLWNVKESDEIEYKTLTLKEIYNSEFFKEKMDGTYFKYQIPKAEIVEFTHKDLDVDAFDFGKNMIPLNFKSIPDDYLYNSVENRMKLLKGIVSVKDPYIRKDFYKDYSVLCRSLKLEPTKTYDGLGYFKDNTDKKITSITYKCKEEAICIKVDAEDELFLTRDFIVTHNTTYGTAITNHAALNNHKVIQIVFEDKEKQIKRKHYSNITNIEARNLSKPENIDYVRETMIANSNYDENIIIKKFNTGEISPLMLKNYIKKVINTGFKPDMVYIDYFECLVPSKNIRDQWQGEAHMMRQLESIAAELDIAVWVATQGNRDSMDGDLITLGKAGGAFAKIQISHIVLTISRTPEDINTNRATLAILKNRAGQTSQPIENAYFNNGTCTINTDNAVVFESYDDYKESENDKMLDLKKRMLEKSSKKRDGDI